MCLKPSKSKNNTATWTGTGYWNGQNGYTFSVTALDNGTGTTKADTLTLTISKGSQTVFTTSSAVPLKGGNLTVHS